MNYIRTTDADGNPIENESIAKEMEETAEKINGTFSSEENGNVKQPQYEPLTQEQVDALNQLLLRMEENGYGTIDTLVELRNTIDRQGIRPEMKNRMLTSFIRAAYLDPRREWSAKQAANALHILTGTAKTEAANIVKSWWHNQNNP